VKDIKNPLIFAFAVIGVLAVLYGAWHLYQKQVAESQHREIFAAPASSGAPDFLHAPPSPPPQP